MAKVIGGIKFDENELQTWGNQYSKEQFYSHAKNLYWVDFEAKDQLSLIDKIWGIAEKVKPKVEKPKEASPIKN